MQQILLIACGGALGSVSRYITNILIDKFISVEFPLGILMVNILGSFFISLLFFMGEESYIPTHIKPMLSIGFLGAFTTFSTYALQSFELFREGNIKLGILNLLLNNGLCLLFTMLGMICAIFINIQRNHPA